MRVLGIIPARAGSKGIKDKNIKLINGIPLIDYTLKSCKKSKLLTEFYVSSDSDKILDLASSLDVKTIKRTLKNAMDTSSINDVIFEVLKTTGVKYDIIVLLQPTAPLRTDQDIDTVISMFQNEEVNSVVSVVELQDIHPARMYKKSDNTLIPFNPGQMDKRRQELEPIYLRNGAIYAIRTALFLESRKIIQPLITPYIMPEDKWLNIDTPRDLKIAQALMK